MKVCENCGIEIGGRDGECLCDVCDAAEGARGKLARERRKQQRRQREQILRDLGLTKVRGALGGTYWE